MLIKKASVAIFFSMLTKMLISVVEKDNQILLRVTSLSILSSQLRMLLQRIQTIKIEIDNSLVILCNLQPLGNLTKTQISLVINLTQTLSNLINSLQRKRAKCVNQTPSLDPMFWAKMMEL